MRLQLKGGRNFKYGAAMTKSVEVSVSWPSRRTPMDGEVKKTTNTTAKQARASVAAIPLAFILSSVHYEGPYDSLQEGRHGGPVQRPC